MMVSLVGNQGQSEIKAYLSLKRIQDAGFKMEKRFVAII